jgi:hypothetical protein|tara:strand:- start:1740 stop:1859 length:120 start_codon:yes stop_codon:yes gene_type:complete
MKMKKKTKKNQQQEKKIVTVLVYKMTKVQREKKYAQSRG